MYSQFMMHGQKNIEWKERSRAAWLRSDLETEVKNCRG